MRSASHSGESGTTPHPTPPQPRYCILLYLVHPRAAYHLSELVEQHAYHTYDAFLGEHEAELRRRPVPHIAHEYYSADGYYSAYVHGSSVDAATPRELESLYDVFCAVRDDEGSHWRTLVNLVQRDEVDAPEGCNVEATLVQ